MAKIQIETGVKVYDLENENGEKLGQLRLASNDFNFAARAKEFISRVNEMIEKSKNTENKTDDELILMITEYDKEIKEAVNELFDDDHASEVVFGAQNAFTTHNGLTFIERFLTAVLPVIQSDMAKEQKASAERINKYTSQVLK